MWILDILFITISFLIILAMIIDIFGEKTAAIILILWFFFLILNPIQFLILAIIWSFGWRIMAKN